MRQITEQEYKKIKKLEEKFYDGVDEYCETLQSTWSFCQHFEEIMEILDSARRIIK